MNFFQKHATREKIPPAGGRFAENFAEQICTICMPLVDFGGKVGEGAINTRTEFLCMLFLKDQSNKIYSIVAHC